MSSFFRVIFFIAAFILISCRNKNSENNEVNPETIYFDYKITAEEGNDNLTIVLQYRDGNEEGETFPIKEPGKILFDGKQVPADSTNMTGIFYEINKPIATFAGKHHIFFTDITGKEYKEEFDFQPFSLLTTVADTLQRGELFFELIGLEAEDYVRVLLSDTSFANDGINRIDTVRDGRIIISGTDLQNLANGPIQLEFIRENERPVKKGTEAGGKFSINYSLKREFILRD